MKLTVIIVNYNVKYFLEQTLISVRKAAAHMASAMEGAQTEIIVVDNNSVDGSVKMLREKFPDVTLMANRENVGFARANNQALRVAQGAYCLLLNPDTVVEEDTFEKVVRFMDEHPEAGGLGVKMVDGKGHFLPESKRGFPSPEVAFYKAFGLSALFPKSRIFGKYHLGYLDKDKIHKVDVLAGAFMLVRSEVLEQTGLLDETFFMYGEDIDFSYRIKQAGYENYYYPETRIIHYKGESTKKQSVNYVFVFYKAMIIFATKHFSRKKAAVFSFLLNLAIYFRALLAITYRMIRKLRLPLLDAVLIFGGICLVAEHGGYGPGLAEKGSRLLLYQIGGAVLIWLTGAYFTNNYRKPFTFQKLLKGVLLGTLTVAAVYAFLPDDFRASNALILLGGGVALLVFTLTRLVLHFMDYKNLRLGDTGVKKVLIVGHPDEAGRVRQLMEDSRVTFNLTGYVDPGDREKLNGQYIGRLNQLGEIIEVYDVDELIFCSRDVPSNKIIHWMTQLQEHHIDYKIAPEESLFIIGSHSKDQPGDFYTINIELGLARPEVQFNKKMLDHMASLLFLLTLPVNVWFVSNKSGFVKHVFNVLFRRLTWVGYAKAGQAYTLPQLPEGVLTPCDALDDNSLDEATKDHLNFLYARDYSIAKDLRLIFRNFRALGSVREAS